MSMLSIHDRMLRLLEDVNSDASEARGRLHIAVDEFLSEWDEYAQHATSIARQSPDAAVITRSIRRDSEVTDLPEYAAFEAEAAQVSRQLLEALRALDEAEREAFRAYYRAREKLVEAAKQLPGITKSAAPNVFKKV